jgi:hypothetical protein
MEDFFNLLEFYKREFTKDYELISDLLDEPLFSLNTLTQFTELYLDYLTNFYPRKMIVVCRVSNTTSWTYGPTVGNHYEVIDSSDSNRLGLVNDLKLSIIMIFLYTPCIMR